jgi:hypothetical protein
MADDFDNPPVPLTLPLDLAGALLGMTRATAYARAQSGTIPTLPGPGRKRVPTAKLEALLGRPLNGSDITNAARKLAPDKQKFLAYQREYREAKALQRAI